ncbi:ABC transporter [Alcanivorax xiamenensis]|uniref:ABC transporter n=1 Tax=Alcanivorax xiamenensis TaxID=1177156 RepID=A0ABQ6Y6E0_9GAMM|nr:type I secretion system permease/ATPase [Alcanivorax xiamenensis]KAF0804555.1 ABC transporter [Alcanivorax xiamenensis]
MNTQDAEEPPVEVSPAPDYGPWTEAMLAVARHYRLEYSEENVHLTAAWSMGQSSGDVLKAMARQLGLACKIDELDRMPLTPWRFPLVVQFKDGQVAVAESIGGDGTITLSYSGDQGLRSQLSRQELIDNVVLTLILRPARSAPDARVDDYVRPYQSSWFRRIILRDLKPYGHVMLASLAANLLALAGILFSRQVYDRVVPAESYATLYVLFSGVLVAMVFDFILRRSRVHITDLLGKRADMRVSDRVFGHALRIKNSEKPRSTGSFIAQIRELEHIRELLTSSTVTAFADMPFFFLFCFVLWYIAGPLVLVPLAAVVLMIIPGLLVQRRLHVLANEAMRESSLRNAMLVETIQGLEDVKALQAEGRFQQQWNHYNAVTADVNLKLRNIANTLVVWSHTVQSGVFAVIVLFGAPMVMEAELSVGSLVAASILASRMMAPMSQITHVMSKWQHAKVAMSSLDQIMERPVDHPEQEKRVHRPFVTGHYQFKQAVFQYPEAPTAALAVKTLAIKPGERIGVLGRNGAGKSTLLQALAGAIEAGSGQVLLDGVNLTHIDPADVRRDVGLLSQNARLFHGTLRDNLMLGAPHVSDQELLATMEMTGASDYLRALPDGLDHPILEGGLGLSGGQRQSLLLSRLLLRQPNILLLDEPTASLDETAEKKFIQRMSDWLDNRTLVVATHRMSMLNLVDRIIVLENGRILLDDTRAKVLPILSKKAPVQSAKKSEEGNRS